MANLTPTREQIDYIQLDEKTITFTLPYDGSQVDEVVFRAVPRGIACACGAAAPIEVREFSLTGLSRFLLSGLSGSLTMVEDDTRTAVPDHYEYAISVRRQSDDIFQTIRWGNFILHPNPVNLHNVAVCECVEADRFAAPVAAVSLVTPPVTGSGAFTVSMADSTAGYNSAGIADVQWVLRDPVGATIATWGGAPAAAADTSTYVVGGTNQQPDIDVSSLATNGQFAVCAVVTNAENLSSQNCLGVGINLGNDPVAVPQLQAAVVTDSKTVKLDGTGSVLGTGATAFTDFAWVVKDPANATEVTFNGAPTDTVTGVTGVSGTYQKPTVVTEEFGNYQFCLTVTDDTAKVSAEECLAVNVPSSQPTAAITRSSPAQGETAVSYDGTGSTPGGNASQIQNYAWVVKQGGSTVDSFSGSPGVAVAGTSLTVTGTYDQPIIDYPAPTGSTIDYEVCLTVTDDQSNTSTEACDTVTLVPTAVPTAVIDQTTTPGTGDTVVTLAADQSELGYGATSFTTIRWRIEDSGNVEIEDISGAPAASATGSAYVDSGTYLTPQFNVGAAGIFTFFLSVTNDLGHTSDEVSLQVTFPAAASQITGQINTTGAVTMTVEMNDGSTPQWDFGDGQTDTGETVTHTYTGTPPFDLVVTVTDLANVTDINFQDAELIGDVTNDLTWIGQLTNIELLNLRNCFVDGVWAYTMPATLTNLQLDNNDLSGIDNSDFLDACTALRICRIHGNRLQTADIDRVIQTVTDCGSAVAGTSLFLHVQRPNAGPSSAQCANLSTLQGRGWSINIDNDPC